MPMTLLLPFCRRRTPRLARDTRGAVYVEFLIAFLPVFIFFLCLLQLAILFSQKLIVDHSAVVGARAAAVVFGDEPGPYADRERGMNKTSADRRDAVRQSVLLALAPLILNGSAETVNVVYPEANAPGGKDQPVGQSLPPMNLQGPQAIVRVRVEVHVTCKIAFANAIACGPAFLPIHTKLLASESIYPYQGASYVYE